MLVRKDRAADDGQIGIGADEIMRELTDEIKELQKYRRVDDHRDMLAVEHDTMLVIVAVGGVLQIPVAAVDLDRNGSEILACGVVLTTRVAHILGTKLALRISDGGGGSRLGDIAGVFFGLRAVDGDIKRAVRGIVSPFQVFSDPSRADVVELLALVKIPVGRRDGGFLVLCPEVADHLARHGGQNTHQLGVEQVAISGRVLDHAVLTGIVDQGQEDIVDRRVGCIDRLIDPFGYAQRIHQHIADDQLVVHSD